MNDESSFLFVKNALAFSFNVFLDSKSLCRGEGSVCVWSSLTIGFFGFPVQAIYPGNGAAARIAYSLSFMEGTKVCCGDESKCLA